MKLVYVAGPYRADTEHGIIKNIRAAEEVALRVWKSGAACICPHKNTSMLGGECDDEVWLRGDLEMLRRCDALVCVDGWQDSRGTVAEIGFAHDMFIPVFYNFEEFEACLELEKIKK